MVAQRPAAARTPSGGSIMQRCAVLGLVVGIDCCPWVAGNGFDNTVVASKSGGVQGGGAVVGRGARVGAELEELVHGSGLAVLRSNVQGRASPLCGVL